MSETSEAMLAGLPDRVQRLLADPPAMDKRLIELVVAWPGLPGGLAAMADALRLFVITWDPLAGMVQRPSGFATTNGAGADLEIVVYLPTWSLVRTATARNSTVAPVMAALVGSAIVTASRYENAVNAGRYPDLAATGEGYRTSSPIRRLAVRSARRTSRRRPSVGGKPSGSRWASEPSPISSNTPLARSTWTGHRWNSPRSLLHTRVARPAQAAGSASPANWPNPEPRCARPTAARPIRS